MGLLSVVSIAFATQSQHLMMSGGRRLRQSSRRMVSTTASVLQFLDQECTQARDPKHATQMQKYFKHIHPFYGIKSPILRGMIKKVQAKHQAEWTGQLLLEASEALLRESHGEKKLLGVYLLGVPANLKKIQDEPQVIETLGGFVERYVNDWATCDTLSSQVVRKLISAKPEYAPKVQSWSRSSYDWKQRASCISFVVLAKHGEYNEVILDIAVHVIQNQERFPQLGVGWVLRELSLADEDAVVGFIKENYDQFTREGLRYAIEKMDKALQKQLLKYEAS